MEISRLTEFDPFEVVNPNKAWCVKEVDRLLDEWRSWDAVVQYIEDSTEFDPNTCSEAMKDGSISRSMKFCEKKRSCFCGITFVGPSSFLRVGLPTRMKMLHRG